MNLPRIRQSNNSPKPCLRQFSLYRSIDSRIIAVTLFFIFASSAASQSFRFWDGSDNDNWRTNANWSGGSSPTADNVAVMERGVSRNNVNLANSSGNDGNREVFELRLRTRGNGTTVEDYFGTNQDLSVNWRFRRGQVSIPDNTTFPNELQIFSWVDTRSSANELTVLMDLDITSGEVLFTAEGEGGYLGDAGSTNSTEILNFYGNLSGAGSIDFRSAFQNSATYKSRLVLHEQNDFSGLM